MEQNNNASLQVALKLKPSEEYELKSHTASTHPWEIVILHNLGKFRDES